MTNYTALSDDEINFLVMVSDNGWEDDAHPSRQNLTHVSKGVAHWEFAPDEVFGVEVEDEVMAIPDYCNSWEEVGPVIKENFLAIQCEDMFEKPSPESIWRADAPSGHHAHDENPCRAACLVFLMMKGV